jgi:hypothetical protein
MVPSSPPIKPEPRIPIRIFTLPVQPAAPKLTRINIELTILYKKIEDGGKNLTTIYITHGHGDHWFGIGALLERFPGARAVASPDVVKIMKEQSPEALKAWWETRMPGRSDWSSQEMPCTTAFINCSLRRIRRSDANVLAALRPCPMHGHKRPPFGAASVLATD